MIPDKLPGDGIPPKKEQLPKSKLPRTDWRRRWFLSLVAITLISAGIAGPVLAQDASSTGPVQYPSVTATNTVAAPAVTPAPTPAATPSAASAEDIHDIRGPMAIPYEWLWAAYLVGGMAVAAILYAAWRLFRRRAPAKPRLPFEVALEKLEAARALMAPATVREYAFTVSEIIRVYIEQRFGEKAAHRTTEEFLSDLLQQTGTSLAQHRRRLEDFLGHCDLMKFARWEASVREMESMLESARVFVLDTRPQPEPAKVPPKRDAPAQPELLQAK
ncbi:MAG: DUF4381 family protein [Methylacidiphilales bacterium]|nr:DUF4381 family protein [Candidatus Methylacidiphilales bacterium]